MRSKFLLKISIVLVVVIFFVFGIVMPQYREDYMVALVDKYNYAKEIAAPKVILYGGSSVAFGIDSERIEQKLGMPVVNMGLHAEWGQTFPMDITRDIIKEGDIVVVLPEYYDFEPGLSNGALAWPALEDNLEFLSRASIKDIYVLYQAIPVYLQRCITLYKTHTGNQSVEGVYSRSAFNMYGDIKTTGNKNIMEKGYLVGDVYSPYVNENLITYYNKYNKYVSEKGAIMLAAGGPIIDSPEQTSEEVIEQVYAQVSNKLEFEFISSAEDYIYPIKYFYDTNYHLNDNGRAQRTEQLIEDIQNWLETQQ